MEISAVARLATAAELRKDAFIPKTKAKVESRHHPAHPRNEVQQITLGEKKPGDRSNPEGLKPGGTVNNGDLATAKLACPSRNSPSLGGSSRG